MSDYATENYHHQFPKDNGMTTKEAIVEAGLDWGVALRDVKYESKEGTYYDAEHQAIVRADNDDLLGIIKPGYKPVQNAQAFSMFDPLIDDGKLDIRSAGYFNGGKKVWMFGDLKGVQLDVKDRDPVNCHLLLRVGHDGRGGVTTFPTVERLWCENQIRMMAEQAEAKFSFAHRGDMARQIEQAKDMLQTFVKRFEEFSQLADVLADQLVTKDDMNQMLKMMFPNKEDGTVVQQAAQESIIENFDNNVTFEDEEIGQSAWGALNAVSYYTNHQQKTEDKEKSLWFGQGRAINQKAVIAATTLFAASLAKRAKGLFK